MDAVRAFLVALDSTDRTACDRWVRLSGADRANADAVQAARSQFRERRMLSDPLVVDLARRALAAALASPVGDATPFRATVWRGKLDVGDPDRCARCCALKSAHGDDHEFRGQDPGAVVDSTWGEFAAWLLERAAEVAPKGEGAVCCPTINRDGRRLNASTLAMTALNLDADGAGEWGRLLGALDDAGAAYVAYQSGGWAPDKPKWHLLLPIERPHDVASPEGAAAWKQAYAAARVVLGALGDLRGDGFDPTVDAPCAPVFVTERRRPEDPARRVLWRPGRALDLHRLAAILPRVEAAHAPLNERARVTPQALADGDFERIADLLEVPMAQILEGRRELYMALTGALLDRGVEPIDARALVEEISDRCPGDPRYTRAEVVSKHREHLHGADTTIARAERGEEYTRIGTLSDRWREVARAIDLALPDPFDLETEARMQATLARRQSLISATSPSVSVSSATTTLPLPPPLPPPPSAAAAVDLHALRRDLVKMCRRKKNSKDLRERIAGAMTGFLLDGEDLVPRYEDPDTGETRVCSRAPGGEPIDREWALEKVAAMVGGRLPTGTMFEHVEYLFEASIRAMLAPRERPVYLRELAARAFKRAVGRKMARDDASCAEARRFGDALRRLEEDVA